MRRILGAAALSCALFSGAFADSTINPNVPAYEGKLISADIRSNFAAARADVNNLLGEFPAATAPINPTVGQRWRKTNVSPQQVFKWSGSAWLQVETFDVANGRVTPYFGNVLLAWQQLLSGSLGASGQCITSTGPSTPPTAQNCVAANTFVATAPLAWNAGTLTASLNYGTDFTLSGSNLILNNVITAAGPIGSASTTPVITFDAKGRLTAVSSATITPAAIGAVPTSRAVTAGTGLSGGCADLTANCSFALASVISAGGPTGSGTAAPVITYNAFGQITGISTATITPPFSALTGQATLAQLPTIGANTVLGSIAGGTPTALSTAQFTTLCNTFTSTLNGCVPNPGTATGKVLSDNGTWITVGGTGTVTGVSAGTGMSFTTITGTGSVAIDKASSSNVYSGASNKVLTSDNIYNVAAGIPYAASLTIDFSTFSNANLSLTGNVTSLTCSNIKTNQSGMIRIIQDATGGRTVPAAWCSQFFWANGTRGVLSTAGNAQDVMVYSCEAINLCVVSLIKAIAN